MKYLKKVIAVLFCFVFVLQNAACATDKQPTGSEDPTDVITVWSAPSTVKVAQEDVKYEDKGKAELTYNVVRNEYESQQLLITAMKKVKSYDLEISDLKCGTDVLSADNISVYNEKYVYTNDSGYEPGTLPDALIPIEAAREYGELTIEKENNAALWITIYIPKELPSGLYEGTFQLTVDKEVVDIPVQVQVNDYTLTDDVTAETLFSWRYDRVGAGEMDSSMDMMETYYEFFLDYRISLQSMPMESLTGEEMVAALEKYYDRLTTYTFLNEVGEISTGIPYAKEAFREQILAVAAASSPERNYFEKAMLYVIDEPDISSDEMTRAYMLDNYKTVCEFLEEFAKEIEKDTTGTYDNFKKIDNWKSYITDIPNVVPFSEEGVKYLVENEYSDRGQRIWNLFNCMCPQFGAFDAEMTEPFLALCEKYGVKVWWYGCCFPIAPRATYHIPDRNLLSARSISWLQKKYDIIGNLYWDAAAYTSENSDSYNQYIDVYTNPSRVNGLVTGDGNLTYPGAAYGIYGPLPSMRLMSIRDGMEEYEILADVERRYEELKAQYGNDFNVDSLMDEFYKNLYDGGSIMYADGQSGLDFAKVRADLIETANFIGKGIDFALYVSNLNGNVATISYYAASDCKIYIDKQLQQPVAGYQYQYELNLEEHTTLKLMIEAADGSVYEVERFISEPVVCLQALSDASVLEHITLTDTSTAEFVRTGEYSTDGTSVLLNVNGVITGNALNDAAFVPMASLSTEMFNDISKLSDVAAVRLDVFNPGEAFKVKIRIYSGPAYSEIGEYTIKSGKNTIDISIKDSGFTKVDEADRITFAFENSEDGITPDSYQLYIDNIVGMK